MAASQFDNPIDLLGIICVVIAVILFLLLGLYLLNSFRRTKRNTTLYMSLILLFGCLALISLVIEQVVLIASGLTEADAPAEKSFLEFSINEIDVFWVALFFAFLAWVTSASAILSACFFTQSFFSEKYKKLLIIPTVMLFFYVVVLVYAPFQWIEVAGDWQPAHDEFFVYLAYILLFPNLWMIVLLFFYLTISLYRRGVPRWKQTLILAVGQTLLSIGYTIEIINIPDPFISLVARFSIMIYPIVVWIGLRRG